MNKLFVLASAAVFSLPLHSRAGGEEAKAVDLSNIIVIRSADDSGKVKTEQQPEILIMNVDQVPMLTDEQVDIETLGSTCLGMESGAQTIALRPIPAEILQVFQNGSAGSSPFASVLSTTSALNRSNWNFFYDFGSDRFFFGYGQPGYYHYGYDQPYYPHYGYYYGNRMYDYRPYGHRFFGGRRYSYYGRP